MQVSFDFSSALYASLSAVSDSVNTMPALLWGFCWRVGGETQHLVVVGCGENQQVSIPFKGSQWKFFVYVVKRFLYQFSKKLSWQFDYGGVGSVGRHMGRFLSAKAYSEHHCSPLWRSCPQL